MRTGATQRVLLIVVDRRELVLGCMSSWLATFRREFEVTSVLDVEKSLRPGEIARAAAVIIGAAVPLSSDRWFEHQVAWLHDKRPDMPIIAITDAGEGDDAATFVTDLNLRGHIPTSSKIDVAAAALRLVLAGGTYLPRQREIAQPAAERPLEQILHEDVAELLRALTPRERGVLQLLQRGMANKAIAYRLNMSSSTVKVHIHNIMVKLNARNRTEAAVAAVRFVNLTAEADTEPETKAETASRPTFAAPSAATMPASERLRQRGADGTARRALNPSATSSHDGARLAPALLSAAQYKG